MAQQIIRRDYTSSQYEDVVFTFTSSTVNKSDSTRYNVIAGLSNYKIDKIEVYIKLNQVVNSGTKAFIMGWGVDFGLEEKWRYFNLKDTGTFVFAITNPTTIEYFLNSRNALGRLVFETQVIGGVVGTEYVTYKYDPASNNNTYILAYVQTPEITSVNPSTGFIDRTINNTFSWASTYTDGTAVTQKSAVLEWKNGTGGAVNTVNINNSTKSHVFVAGTFPKATSLMWRVKIVDTNDLESEHSTWSTIDSRGDLPTIGTLEPDSINQNLNLPVVVSWTSTYQSTFKLTIDGNVYTGATATSLTIPANTLTSGNKTMTLEVTYIPTWATSTADHRKTTKIVSFLAYGNPPTPILDSTTIYNTATPTFTWQSNEQVAYQLQLLKGLTTTINTNEVISTSKSYLSAVALENNTSYTLKLRVKNQYGLWSNYATKTINTSFTVLPKATIAAYPNIGDGSIVISYTNNYHVEFSHCEIWRREQYGEWNRMCTNMRRIDTWIDYYVAAKKQYEYKIRSVSKGGGISESDIAVSITSTTGYTFYNVEDLSSNLRFRYNAEVIPTYNRNDIATMYAGCNAPSYETDGVIFKTFSMTFATKNISDIDKLISLIRKTKVFLYKDLKGNKAFGMITGNFSPKTSDLGITTISFAFVELSFLEKDVFDGINLPKLLYFDGTWKFDSSQTFDGVI